MNIDLAELNNLDFKNIGSWKPVPKAVALAFLFLLVLGLGYWFDWRGLGEERNLAKEKEMQLRETFMGKKRQAANLDAHRQQLKDIDRSFGALLRQLPNKSEMDALLTDINQAGLGRGLEFELFKPAASENLTEFYAELPIEVKVTGGYHDLAAFASDIAQLPRIVTLNEIDIAPEKDGKLALKGIAHTYRYLDDDEVAAQKKAAEESKKKGAK